MHALVMTDGTTLVFSSMSELLAYVEELRMS